MKRGRFAKVAVLLVLLLCGGAIVSMAVAWACAWFHWELWTSERNHSLDQTIDIWAGFAPPDWPKRNVVGRCYQYGARRVDVLWLDVDVNGDWGMIVVEAGLPLRCMRGAKLSLAPPWVRREMVEFFGEELPLHPLWPGFAINTIFYAAILWLLFAAPGRVRRWRRISRGLCPACAYPVGASVVCSECGKPVGARGVEPVV